MVYRELALDSLIGDNSGRGPVDDDLAWLAYLVKGD